MFDLSSFSDPIKALEEADFWLVDRKRTIEEVRTFCKLFNEQFQKSVSLKQSAMSVVLNTNNEVLLLKRNSDIPFPDKFSFPGGTKHATDSSLEKTATRELFEETGIVASSVTKHSTRFTTFASLLYVYRIEVFQIHPFTDSNLEDIKITDEHTAYTWQKPTTILGNPDMFPLSGETILQEILIDFA